MVPTYKEKNNITSYQLPEGWSKSNRAFVTFPLLPWICAQVISLWFSEGYADTCLFLSILICIYAFLYESQPTASLLTAAVSCQWYLSAFKWWLSLPSVERQCMKHLVGFCYAESSVAMAFALKAQARFSLPCGFQNFGSEDFSSYHDTPVLPLWIVHGKHIPKLPVTLWEGHFYFLNQAFLVCGINSSLCHGVQRQEVVRLCCLNCGDPGTSQVLITATSDCPLRSYTRLGTHGRNIWGLCSSQSGYINPLYSFVLGGFRDTVDEGSDEWMELYVHRDPCRHLLRCTYWSSRVCAQDSGMEDI